MCVKCVEGKVSSGFEEFVVLADGQEANWEVVERILFIYAKLNPGHSYVQVSQSFISIRTVHSVNVFIFSLHVSKFVTHS